MVEDADGLHRPQRQWRRRTRHGQGRRRGRRQRKRRRLQQLPERRALPQRPVAGAKTKPANDAARTWAVDGAGTLKAVGSNDGKPVATFELRPAGPAAKLSLATEKTTLPHDFDDVATVVVTIADAAGNHVAGSNPLVTFKLTGPAKIAAVDNGAGDNHESFQGSQIHAVAGQCCVSIRSTADSGAITLTASAPGLADGTLHFTAQPAVR